MVMDLFLAPKTGTGLSCTIYKIPVNFSLSLDMKPGTSNPNKWYRKFRLFREKRKKGNTSKGITFLPENFHRDEPFHLNSPRNFRVFHTNGKRSQFVLRFYHIDKTDKIDRSKMAVKMSNVVKRLMDDVSSYRWWYSLFPDP